MSHDGEQPDSGQSGQQYRCGRGGADDQESAGREQHLNDDKPPPVQQIPEGDKQQQAQSVTNLSYGNDKAHGSGSYSEFRRKSVEQRLRVVNVSHGEPASGREKQRL
ncbi:hypothetical protein YDYSY3_05840 [Paenibacillus chitinolyticus]|nr:hypothetical protein YDYSY3_05840 [Paenibacillus chitinolyticus]